MLDMWLTYICVVGRYNLLPLFEGGENDIIQRLNPLEVEVGRKLVYL